MPPSFSVLVVLLGATATSAFHLSTPRAHRPSMSRVGPIEAGLLNALRKKREVEQPEQIAVGGELPEVDIEVVVSQGLIEAAVDEFGDAVAEQAAKDDAPDRATLSLRDAVGKERTILLGMPGAFTPACDEVHLPDYIKSASELAQAGVAFQNRRLAVEEEVWVENPDR